MWPTTSVGLHPSFPSTPEATDSRSSNAASSSEASYLTTWDAVRSALLACEVHIPDPNGKSEGRTVSCAVMQEALETCDRWLQGERLPALQDDLPPGSGPIATRQFIRAYKLIANRPAIKEAVDRNLRETRELAPIFDKHRHCGDSMQAASNDAIEKAIRDATEAGCFLPLAAAIYPPLIEAVCASRLLPGELSEQDRENARVREYGRTLDQLKTYALSEQRPSRLRAPNPDDVRAAAAKNTTVGDPKARAETHRDIALTEEVIRASRSQLERRPGVPIVPRIVVRRKGYGAALSNVVPGQATSIGAQKSIDVRHIVDDVFRLQPDIAQIVATADLARPARRQAKDTATLLAMLDRVAPTEGRGESIASEALLAGADHETVARIHEAIAMTIAHALNGLRDHSGRSARIVPPAPAGVDAHYTQDAPASGPHPLCFRTGSARSFAVEWAPNSKTVNFDSERDMVKLFDHQAPPTDLHDPIKTELLAISDALRKTDVAACVPEVLETWGSWHGGECGPMLGTGVQAGLPAIPTRIFFSVFDKLIVGNPDFEDRIEQNLRSHPALSTLFPAAEQAPPPDAIVPIGENRSSSAEDVEIATQARQAQRQAIKQMIVRATEQEHYAELAATLVAPVLEAICDSGLQPRMPNEVAFFRQCQHQMNVRRHQLQSEARLNISDHLRGMSGVGDQPATARNREAILAMATACNAEEELSFGEIEKLLEQDARHTAFLQWWLDCATDTEPGDASLAPRGPERGIDEHIVSLIHNAIALTLADSINALPRYSEFERSMPDVARQFEPAGTTPDPLPTNVRPVLHRLYLKTPSGDFPFALEQRPGSDRVNVVGPTVSVD